MCHVHAWYSQRPEENIRSPELELQTVVSRSVDAGSLVGPGPLEKRSVLLTDELPLQPPEMFSLSLNDD